MPTGSGEPDDFVVLCVVMVASGCGGRMKFTVVAETRSARKTPETSADGDQSTSMPPISA